MFVVSPKGVAQYADVHFVESLGEYPIVNTTASLGTIDVTINRNNQIVAVYVDRPGSLTKQQDYLLKNFTELEA